jgi:pSer/pThr/pTyr-binding forkhead associated (FHA) protein
MPADPLGPHVARPAELRERLAAERRGTPCLVYRDGDDRQLIVELTPARPRLTIGRSAASDIALGWDGEVSRLHAELELAGGHWVISDDHLSHNGTYVNEQRVPGSRRLRPGDVVRAGATLLAFVAPGAESGSATRTAGRPLDGVAVTPAQRRVLVALCRPVPDGGAPASNRATADELVIALDTVKSTLTRLFELFGVGDDVPQNAKRTLLARRALQLGIVHPDELVKDRSA